jgi:probable phosphoglycerate mutase
MKVVHFARHGETDGNTGEFQQGPMTPLNATGRLQAGLLAVRCATMSFEVIVSSTYARARETTGFVRELNPKPVVYSDLFVERRRPTSNIGMRKSHPDARAFETFLKEHFGKPNMRLADEENFEDLKARALECLAFLEARPEGEILVVGHGLFMRMILGIAVFGRELSGHEANAFCRAFRTINTGITTLVHDANYPFPWKILTWNDHSHVR